MGYTDEQHFYILNKKAGFLSGIEIQALDRYFLYQQGGSRLAAPEKTRVIAELARWLVDHSQGKEIDKSPNRAHLAATRLLNAGLNKLKTEMLKPSSPQPATSTLPPQAAFAF